MRLIKSPIRSSTGRFGSRYGGNSPSACAESAGAWNSAAPTAVTTNKDEYFVSTPHLPQPTRVNLRVFRCVLGWGMSGFGPLFPLGILVACAVMAPAAEFSASAVKVDITPSASKWLAGYPARQSTGVHDRLYHRIVAMDDGHRKSTRLNSSHLGISYAVFCL